MKHRLLLLIAFITFGFSTFAQASCDNWVYYLTNYVGNTSTIYQVTLDDIANTATLTELKTVDEPLHIAFNKNDGLLYLIKSTDGSYRTLDVSIPDGALSASTSLSTSLANTVQAAFAPNGKLVLGSTTTKTYVSVDVATGITSPYASGDIIGGDLVFDSTGQPFMVTRASGVLYQVNPGFTNTMIGSVSTMVMGMSLKDDDSFLVSSKGSSKLARRTNAGANDGDYDIMLGGSSFTTSDGDMASGCAAPEFNEGDCPNFSMFYSSHGPGISGSDIFKIDFSGSDAIMTYLVTVPFETHIAFDATSNIVYLVDKHGGFIRPYNPTLDMFLGDISMDPGLGGLHAVVFNPTDGLLYVGDDTKNKIFTLNPADGSHTFFADAPIHGGDLSFQNNTLYLGTRDGHKLYDMTGGTATLVGTIPAEINGMAQANNSTGLIMANTGASVFTEVNAADGTVANTFNAMLNGASFTMVNGDMAAGCDGGENIEECENFIYYYTASNSPGVPQGNIYKGEIVGGNFVLTYVFNPGQHAHIALNTDNGEIYSIDTNGKSLKTFDSAGNLLNSVNPGLSGTVALVWNPANGMLYVGSNNKKVYELDPVTGSSTLFASNLPVHGGDLVINNAGELFVVQRVGSSSSRLYNITSGTAVFVADVNPGVNGAALTDAGGFIMSEGLGSTSFHTYDGDGNLLQTLNAVDEDGNPFTVVDGDMASGCMGGGNVVDDCNYELYYAHDPSGNGNTDIFKMTINPDNTTSNTLITSLSYSCQALAATPEGLLYIINRSNAGTYIVWDLNTNAQVGGTFNMKKSGGANIGSVPTAAYHNGILYVGSTDGNIYAVNPLTGIAATSVSGNVNGGDLFFDSADNMWLINRAGGIFYNITGGSSFNVGITNINGAALLENGNVMVANGDGGSLFYEVDLSAQVVTSVTYETGLPLNAGDLDGRCSSGSNEDIPGDCNATVVEEYIQGTSFGGGSIAANRTDATKALGAPERTDANVFVSLGYGGSLTLSFNGSIPNGPGDDIEIVETSFGYPSCASYPEFADVYVSVDGINFAFAKTICRTDGFVDISDAGAFAYVNYVKIVNNDALSTTPDAFDVDGVVALHNCIEAPRPLQAIEASSTFTSYPNPTTGDSQVIFATPKSGKATVAVYDMNGRMVKAIFDQNVDANQEYRLNFDGSALPNGVYIYKLTTDEGVKIEKFVIGH